VSDTRQPITPATGAEWRRRREAGGNLPDASNDERPRNEFDGKLPNGFDGQPRNGFDGQPRNGFDGQPRNGFDGQPRNGFDGQPRNGFRVPAYATVLEPQDVTARFAEAQQAGLAAMLNIAVPAALPRPPAAAEAVALPEQVSEASLTSATPGPAAPVLVSTLPAAVTEQPAVSPRPEVSPPDPGTTKAGGGLEFTAPGASDSFAQLRALPLIVVLTVQAFLSLRLVTSNTAYTDEALYLWAGRLEWSHWLHHTPVPPFASYFSGAPVLYPPIAALANGLGGLTGARVLSLCFMLGATVLLHGVTRRIFDRPSAAFAAALFAGLGSAQFLGAFATYDAMALFLLATAVWVGVRAAACRTWGARLALLLLAAAALVTADAAKYAAALFDPVVLISIACFHWRELGRRAGIAAGALVACGAALGMASMLAWGGKLYINGIVSTTLARSPGNWPMFGILFVSAGWVGVVAVLAVIGAIVVSCTRRASTMKMLAWTLAAAAFLAPGEQARIHVFTSLFKHVAFGGWFAAVVAGYALTAFVRAVPVAKSRGALKVVTLGIGLATISGSMLAVDHFGTWQNVDPVLPALATTLGDHPGPLLTDESPPLYYYLEEFEPWQLLTSIQDSSWWAVSRDIRQRRAEYILLSFAVSGGGCGNEDPAVKKTQARCVHNIDLRVLYQIISDGGYRLVARIPYRTTSFKSDYMLWVREGPGR
jgi:hypothetical protein